MKERPYYTITSHDGGRHDIRAFGKTWPAVHFIGRILPGDVGKRVYKLGDVVQVESDEQRAARVAAEGGA